MSKVKTVAQLALAGVVSLTMAQQTAQADPAKAPDVKCYGVAGASKNDCGTVVSACAASIATPGACYAWIYAPKGICEKLANSSVGQPAANCKGPTGQPAK